IADRPFQGQTPVTVSVGVSTARRPLPAEDLLRQADVALYSAKGAGRNRAVHHDAVEREARHSGGDVRIRAFATRPRGPSERGTGAVARRGRLLLEALQDQADRDGLTGLFNRGCLDRRLPREADEARLARRRLCLALLDVDHFGAVNK